MDAWDEGYDAALDGDSIQDNPYESFVEAEMEDWAEWRDGYDTARMELQRAVA